MERVCQIITYVCMALVLVIVFVLLGCAPVVGNSPHGVRRPATTRDDCPRGMGMTSKSHGTACWPLDQPLPSGCKPYRCPDTGYLFWDCPEPGSRPELQPTPQQKPNRMRKATAYACSP